MFWNFGLGVNPRLTLFGGGSELHDSSGSFTMMLSGQADNGEPVGIGDSKMMLMATAAASLERSGANSSGNNRGTMVGGLYPICIADSHNNKQQTACMYQNVLKLASPL
jgi:hypothetical protein